MGYRHSGRRPVWHLTDAPTVGKAMDVINMDPGQ